MAEISISVAFGFVIMRSADETWTSLVVRSCAKGIPLGNYLAKKNYLNTGERKAAGGRTTNQSTACREVMREVLAWLWAPWARGSVPPRRQHSRRVSPHSTSTRTASSRAKNSSPYSLGQRRERRAPRPRRANWPSGSLRSWILTKLAASAMPFLRRRGRSARPSSVPRSPRTTSLARAQEQRQSQHVQGDSLG